MKKVKFIGASESFTPFGVMKPVAIVTGKQIGRAHV